MFAEALSHLGQILCFVCFYLIIVNLVVSTSAAYFVEKLFSEMRLSVLSRTLNLHSDVAWLIV